MWNLKACPGKILRIRPSEIEREGDFSGFSQSCSLMAIYLSDHWKFLKIRLFEIEFQSDFSKFVFNNYIPFRLLES